MAFIIGVLNPKGGTGKSTVSINLARAFQRTGHKVLIVDTDPQGTSRDWSMANQEYHPGSDHPKVVGLDQPVLDTELPQVAKAFNIIIIDGAAKLQEMTASALKIVDGVVIPVQTSLADIWSAAELVELIKAKRQTTRGKPQVAFLVSRQTKNTRLAAEIDSALEDFGLPVLQARTSNRVIYMESLSEGSTVLDQEPLGFASQEIMKVRDELIALFKIKKK